MGGGTEVLVVMDELVAMEAQLAVVVGASLCRMLMWLRRSRWLR